ncbi:MAG TPA: adenylyl-sulfate kinase [Rubricoccaceae bacterium]|jgi:bifunctional enzyme CysN/CysC
MAHPDPPPAGVFVPPPANPEAGSGAADLLRITTAGSVDDGKSTLLGRLLVETRSVLADQLAAVTEASRRRGHARPDLALLTDGLRAEREQGITIDVAYRAFATPRRAFLVADTPGHVQYTRNMVTGASTASLAIVLVDARRGVQTQSRRHAFVASLLGIRHLVFAVNKMDLVDYAEAAFTAVADEAAAFAARLGVPDVAVIPVSALHGDNVAERSPEMLWYGGATLLHHLEHVSVGGDRNPVDFRFPVQLALRPDAGFRGFAGTVASGAIRAGERVAVLPSGVETSVRAVYESGREVAEARAGDVVVITLADEVDVARGDLLVRDQNRPLVGTSLEAMVCWMDDRPLAVGRRYVLRQTTRETPAHVTAVVYRVDVDTLHRAPTTTLSLNDIGRVRIETASPVSFDAYRDNAATGAFVLVDADTNATVAAGMVRGGAAMVGRADVRSPATAGPDTQAPGTPRRSEAPVSPDVVRDAPGVTRAEREARQGHRGGVVWLTGPPGAGKSAVAREAERRLFARGATVLVLDGDDLRHGLSGDLGFAPRDRRENVRRAGEVAHLLVETGAVVLCSFVSPSRADRAAVRARFAPGDFAEALVTARPETLRARDPKGLYARAAAGEIADLTGVGAPYESPETPDLVLDTDALSLDAAVEAVLAHLAARGCVPD